MKIVFTDSAFCDLEAIREYYLEEGVPHVGEEFVISIISHVQTLKQHSDIGRLVPESENPKIRKSENPKIRKSENPRTNPSPISGGVFEGENRSSYSQGVAK